MRSSLYFLLVSTFILNLFAAAQTLPAKPAPADQNPSPMAENTRTHERVTKTEIPGKRYTLSIGTLLLPANTSIRPTMPLYIHFHGASWLAEKSVSEVNSKAAVLTVNLGSGSGVYSQAFQDPKRFEQLLAEAAHALDVQNPPQFRPIVLSSFSAGYGQVASMQPIGKYDRVDLLPVVGAIREILRIHE